MTRKLRVLTLMHPDLIPPESATEKDSLEAPWRAEYNVLSTLKELGHTPLPLGAYNDLSVIQKAYAEQKPHATFNLLEEFDGYATFDQHVVSYLEVQHRKYTGNSSRGLMLARDKALSKKILAYHKIPIPGFQVFQKGQKIRPRKNLKYPFIVKSLTEEASLGISQASVVNSKDKLIERVQFIFENVGSHAIAERYIEGRELYVGMLGNQQLTAFTPWELLFKDPQSNLKFIATSQVKHNPNYRKKHDIDTGKAQNISDEVLERIQKVCKRTYKALYLSGYARIDLRLTESGIPFVVEANPNPDISEVEDFAQAAKHDGYSYKNLIQKILNLSLARTVEW